MVEELDTATLTPEALLALSRRSDPVGIISIYFDADPGADPALRAASIDIRNRLSELRRRIDSAGPPERVRALADGLRRLEPEIERLIAPPSPGRGRALFAGLGSGELTRFACQLPLPNRVVLNGGVFIHPLLELLDEARPAGVVLASRERARLFDCRRGELSELEELLSDLTPAPHERAGPVGSAPTSLKGTPQREQRQAREHDQTSRFLEEVAAVTQRVAEEQGWEQVLLSGGERLTDPLVQALPAGLSERVIRDSRLLVGQSQASLTAVVLARLREAHDAYEARLVQYARETSSALGLSQVLAALNEGRVDHLIYDPEVRYRGTVGEGGGLYAPGERGPTGSCLIEESRLTERMVECALDTGARITPVQGAVSGALVEAQGVAALLRW